MRTKERNACDTRWNSHCPHVSRRPAVRPDARVGPLRATPNTATCRHRRGAVDVVGHVGGKPDHGVPRLSVRQCVRRRQLEQLRERFPAVPSIPIDGGVDSAWRPGIDVDYGPP